jgi:hypothetical protein
MYSHDDDILSKDTISIGRYIRGEDNIGRTF